MNSSMFVGLGPGARSCTCAIALAVLVVVLVAHAATVGQAAPTFNGKDSQGKPQSLAQYRGKYVVLEWTNRTCPFTKKHYDSGNMQALQQEWTGKGVVWLTVLSSSPAHAERWIPDRGAGE